MDKRGEGLSQYGHFLDKEVGFIFCDLGQMYFIDGSLGYFKMIKILALNLKKLSFFGILKTLPISKVAGAESGADENCDTESVMPKSCRRLSNYYLKPEVVEISKFNMWVECDFSPTCQNFCP